MKNFRYNSVEDKTMNGIEKNNKVFIKGEIP